MNYTLSINMAMTLDGKVARPDGKWYGLSSREDKKRMDFLRSGSDALILGKNSILNDDPVIHLRYIEGDEPTPIILLRKGILPKTKNVFMHTKKKPIVFCLEENYSEVELELSDAAEIFVFPDLEPNLVLKKLLDLGFQNILLEGGPTLNDSFFRAGLINKINLTIVPFLIGEKNLPSIVTGNLAYENFDLEKWEIIHFEKNGNEVFLTYEKKSRIKLV